MSNCQNTGNLGGWGELQNSSMILLFVHVRSGAGGGRAQVKLPATTITVRPKTTITVASSTAGLTAVRAVMPGQMVTRGELCSLCYPFSSKVKNELLVYHKVYNYVVPVLCSKL